MQAVFSFADHWWTLYMMYTLGKYLAPCFNLLNMMHLLGCITYSCISEKSLSSFPISFPLNIQLLSTYCLCNGTSWAKLQYTTVFSPLLILRLKGRPKIQGSWFLADYRGVPAPSKPGGWWRAIDLVTWESFRVKERFPSFWRELLKNKKWGDFLPCLLFLILLFWLHPLMLDLSLDYIQIY